MHHRGVFGLLASFSAVAIRSALAKPCVGFDNEWNLYLFGAGSQDVGLGPQDSWSAKRESELAPDVFASPLIVICFSSGVGDASTY